jgi:hypothetical protein
MKVKIGEHIYDSDEEPIVIILNESEKDYIKLMKDDKYRYALAPKHAFKDQETFETWVMEGTEL